MIKRKGGRGKRRKKDARTKKNENYSPLSPRNSELMAKTNISEKNSR